ncbi:molecular chaperone Tir [Roseateles chitinivorans]|uniref:Molecular chaperone Tir n=1 Tax=Roseateles chitinivorans TaxID=2917965 RepID=A0A2G9C3C3_9BURK|nr:CesT family type III secretion system chaperone [Roseateles chitinivorans]PIM50865.1 molecular chaperone Tir [Roseateles chitinivorans]
MSQERYQSLVRDLCQLIELPDAEAVLRRGTIEVEGFEVHLANFSNDPGAMYLNFHYGIVTAGRTLRVFRLLLEANLSVYAQDQAQLGLHADTGGIVLIVRVPLSDAIDAPWLAETLTHYAEHGRYWRDNIANATEEMFAGICAGDYFWIRA